MTLGFVSKTLIKRHEFYISLVIVAFSFVLAMINSQFLSLETLFDLLNSSASTGVLAIGTLIVMISGGIDVSFSAIAAVSMYVTVYTLNIYGGSTPIAFIMACLIGAVLGMVNAILVCLFNLPTMIVTLATSNIFYGTLMQTVPQAHIAKIPEFLADFGSKYVFVISTSGGKTIGLSAISTTMLAIAVITTLILRYTSLGRNIYAIGGSKEAAKRQGISIWKTQIFIYCFAGMMAGTASILNVSLIRYVNPFNVYGQTMDVIAAVVLGGACVSGGSGTVIGTILGVILLFLIKNNLVLMGIPSIWDSVIVGAIIIVSITLTTFRKRRNGQK